MSLVGFANTRLGPTAGLSLARMLPKRTALALADRLANRLAHQPGNRLVLALRHNQAAVLGLPQDHPQVSAAVEAVIRNTARHYVSLFQVIKRGWEGLRQEARLDPELVRTTHECLETGKGMFYAGAHTVGFDHLLVMLGGLDYPAQVLSYANPQGSYPVENQIRRRFGLNLTPIDFRSLRQALTQLRGGGIVITAVDRRDAGGEPLNFFGRPAVLPVGHVRLALRAGAPIMVGASHADPDGGYRAVVLEVIEPGGRSDEPEVVRGIAQKVVSRLEAFIRERPSEWLMFHPAWPDG